MARPKNSEETKLLLRAATKKFIDAVENSEKKHSPEIIASYLDIGEANGGKAWRLFRNSEQKWWSFQRLRQLIEKAALLKYFGPDVKKQLIAMIPAEKLVDMELTAPNKAEVDGYKFDASVLLFSDVQASVRQLLQQLLTLKSRISCGHERVENLHYINTCFSLLEPIQEFVARNLSEKNDGENSLLREFGKSDYREIFNIDPTRSRSAWDVGYSEFWWLERRRSEEEITEIRRALDKAIKEIDPDPTI